ncbi:MAG: hypothetical protein JJU31_06490 [Wenzhouxiangella sp.]|nr:hypothetical protein [Wenzhouxiangella sp.]MCH8476565.1 hypothetical protein [Wenzhouxiangella sp.]TVR93425.1 MAG: hypothetical protein EA418_11945 [Wenzhouxiangellaceae bacterium]
MNKLSLSDRFKPDQRPLQLALLLLIGLVSVAFWPGLHGDWGRDDFMQLAMVRMLGSPWPLFYTDHFVAMPGAVFRPLGFAGLWLGGWLFGTDYFAHALISLMLHLGVCLALFTLLRSLAVGLMTATLVSLLFGLHPTVIGTALWWSARFDLLAALFVLLGLVMSLRFIRYLSIRDMLAASVLMLAAMLSKEIGLIGALGSAMILAIAALARPDRRLRLLFGLALAAASVLIFFLWRHATLGTFGSGIASGLPLSRILLEGSVTWLQLAWSWSTFWERLTVLERGLMLVGSLMLLVSSLGLFRAAPPPARPASTATLPSPIAFVIGLSLLLLPALLQAPVVVLNAAPLMAQESAVETAMQSRLYYMSLAGLAMLLGIGLDGVFSRLGRGTRAIASVALLLIGLALGLATHQHARAFADRSSSMAELAHQISDAVLGLDLPAERCHVLVLDLAPPPEWSRYVSVDSMVKALHPVPQAVGHCLFHANFITFFHLVDKRHAMLDPWPFLDLSINDQPVPRRTIGQLTTMHLQYPDQLPPEAIANLQVLRHEGGQIVNSQVRPDEWPYQAR